MKRAFNYFSAIVVFLLLLQLNILAQGASIEQKLIVTQNDMTLNGVFQISLQVKSTNLPQTNLSGTLGSATIDIVYEKVKITFDNTGTQWSITSGQGYSVSATDNNTFIRLGILGMDVGNSGKTGYDITSVYSTWAVLKFKIADASGTTNLNIAAGSNAVGVFKNPQNNPRTGEIINITNLSVVPIVSEPLPVELTTFQANQNGSKVSLSWKTVTEVNNYGFEVERKTLRKEKWEKIGFVKGYGNSNSTKAFMFEDSKLSYPGVYHYRLKQIDIEGNYTYSDEVEINFLTEPMGFSLDQNYPNPFNPLTVIRFTLEKESYVRLTIYNSLGKVVNELVNGIQQAGFNEVNFNAREVSSGIYFYELQANALDGSKNFRAVKRMLFLK